MRRREFIILFGSIAAAWSSKLRAQQPERIRRVALLIALTKSDPASAACVAAFRRGLEELGWQDGHDLRIDIRWAAGDPQKELAYAAEFHRLAPNVAVAHGTPAVFAFKTETPTIPIVFVQVVDPVQEGIISNLSHPGGNITGFMGFEFAIAGKWLQILKKTLEVLPSARRAVDRAGYKVSLLVDGGVRRGSDVFKALGLGANAVLVGRPVLWGLAVNGQGGVTRVLSLLNDELTLTMKLAGCARLDDISSDLLYADGEFRTVCLGGLPSRRGRGLIEEEVSAFAPHQGDRTSAASTPRAH